MATTIKIEGIDTFVIRPTDEEKKEFVITIGNHLATTKRFESEEQAEEYAKEPHWDMMVALVSEMIDIKTKEK